MGFLCRFLVAVSIVCCSIAAAGCSKKNDLSGTWKGKITLPETGKSLSDLEFSLAQKGSDVTGMMHFMKQGGKLPLTGTNVDGKVALKSPMKNGLAISITGKMEGKRKVTGTAILDYDAPQIGKRRDTTALELTR